MLTLEIFGLSIKNLQPPVCTQCPCIPILKAKFSFEGDYRMKLINEKVVHKLWGIGTIVDQDEENEKGYVTVAFSNEEKKFQTPNAFDTYLRLLDDNKMDEMKTLLDNRVIILTPTPTPSLPHSQPKPKPLSPKKPSLDDCNLAIKCTRCDGGSSKINIGYNGVCSDQMIAHNILKKKTCMVLR